MPAIFTRSLAKARSARSTATKISLHLKQEERGRGQDRGDMTTLVLGAINRIRTRIPGLLLAVQARAKIFLAVLRVTTKRKQSQIEDLIFTDQRSMILYARLTHSRRLTTTSQSKCRENTESCKAQMILKLPSGSAAWEWRRRWEATARRQWCQISAMNDRKAQREHQATLTRSKSATRMIQRRLVEYRLSSWQTYLTRSEKTSSYDRKKDNSGGSLTSAQRPSLVESIPSKRSGSDSSLLKSLVESFVSTNAHILT